MTPQNAAQSNVVMVPVRDAASAQQINTILGVMGVTMAAINTVVRVELDMEEHDEPAARRHLLSGEPKIAAELTFINCCRRLDTILEENNRWSIEIQDRIESDRREASASQLAVMKAQAHLAKELTTPHYKYRPTVAKATDGDWVAFIGDPEDLSNALVGAGKTPQLALADFDAKFDENLPPAVADWAKQYEQQINQGLQTSPFPKETNDTVDARVNGETDLSQVERNTGQQDSEAPEDGIPPSDDESEDDETDEPGPGCPA